MKQIENVAYTEAYKAYMAPYQYVFAEEYFLKEEEIRLSDEYMVSIRYFNHSYMETEKWGHSISGEQIQLMNSKGELLFKCETNGKPFFSYLKHSNGHEYFICGEGLYSFHKYNITTNESVYFVSGNILEGIYESDFWYIREWLYNPKNDLIAVNGQDTLNNCTVTICDFADPEVLPLKAKRIYALKEIDDVPYAEGWNDDGSLRISLGEEEQHIVHISESRIRELFTS